MHLILIDYQNLQTKTSFNHFNTLQICPIFISQLQILYHLVEHVPERMQPTDWQLDMRSPMHSIQPVNWVRKWTQFVKQDSPQWLYQHKWLLGLQIHLGWQLLRRNFGSWWRILTPISMTVGETWVSAEHCFGLTSTAHRHQRLLDHRQVSRCLNPWHRYGGRCCGWLILGTRVCCRRCFPFYIRYWRLVFTYHFISFAFIIFHIITKIYIAHYHIAPNALH